MKKILLALVLTIVYDMATAQYPQVSIPGSEVRKLTSAIVNQEYELQVLLPAGYDKGNKKYPVVYLMDSQWDFPLVKSIYGQQYYDGFIPELIIVGVTWGGNKPNPDSLRVRDYTPTNDGRAAQGGHADQFISFLKNELFPFVASNYPASGNERILMGCSLGGLFTMYAMFTQPGLFTGYVAASPAVGWDNEVMYKYGQQLAAAKPDKPLRVYMTVGDVEGNRATFEKFAASVKAGKYPVIARSKILENTGHSGTKSETYTRGLQFIFEKPKLNLPMNVLNRYTGKYDAGGGRQVDVKIEKGQLVLYASPQEKFSLYAASDSEFYSTAAFMNLAFKMEGAKASGFQLNLYGASMFAKRI